MSSSRPTNAAERPLYEDPVIYGRRWFLLGVMCLSLVMVVMSVAGLNVALPSIQEALHASASQLQWIIDSYALLFAALLLTAGALGDRFGRKGALLVGLTVFATGSAVSGLATGAAQVIVGRAITGVGAAFVMPATLSLLTSIFPPDERKKAIAVWAGFAGAGGALGPIVSGALLEGFWWGSALLVNIPIVAAVIAIVALRSPSSRDPEATPLDPVGTVLSFVGLSGLVYGIIEGPEKGWTTPLIVFSFVVAAVALGGFLLWERRTAHPMLPLSLFRDRRLSVGSGVITVSFFALFGFFFLFAMYVQFVRGYSPLDAGVATLPAALTFVAFAPRSATWAERMGTGPTISLGFILAAIGFAGLATVGPHSPYLLLAVAMVFLAAGMSLIAAPATGSIMISVPEAKAGVGSAINDTTREVGGALGIAVMGSIASAMYRSSLDLRDLPLPAPVASAARESVGAAAQLAHGLPGGGDLVTRAGEAFAHAFRVGSVVAGAICLAGALAVSLVFSRRTERRLVGGTEPGPEPDVDPFALAS